LQIDLDLINLEETIVSWKSFTNSKPSVILIKEFEAELSKNKKELIAQLASEYQVQALYVNRTLLPPGNLTLNADLRYELETQQLTIGKSKINYDIFSAKIQGTYAHQKNRHLDLYIDASSNDLQVLSLIMKRGLIRKNPNLLERGGIYIKGRVFGELKNQPPQFDISFGVKNLTLRLPNSKGKFEDIGFEGNFSSGKRPDYSEARFEIRNLNGKLPGGFLKGQFHVHNFVDPYVTYKLGAQLELDGYDQIFQLDFLKALSGRVSLEANFDGPFKQFGEHRMDSSRSSVITLDNLSFVLSQTNQQVSGLSGKIETKNNQSEFQELTFHYGENDLRLNATIDNLVYFFFKKEKDIFAAGNLNANQLFTKDFIFDTLQTAAVQDRISDLSFNFHAKTSTDSSTGKSSIAFDIRDLSAKLDKLPEIKMINTAGKFNETDQGLKLDLDEFHATLPYGKLEITGDLLVRSKRLWEFNTKLKADKFPWTYINELIAEIKEDTEPNRKNIPLNKMEDVTADLDLSAAVITYPFDINKLEVRDSKINYSYQDSKPISVDKLNLALQNLHFNHPPNSGVLSGLKSTKGTMDLSKLNVPGLNTIDVKMNIAGQDDKLDIDFSSVTQITKNQKGKFVLDMSKKELEYHLQYFVEGASLEYFVQKYYKKKFMEGTINYALDIHTKGATWAQAKENLSGEIEIAGDSLRLYGIDIDNVLKKYEKSQNFNLTDVGAVLIAGPVGLAVTKGTDFVSLAAINFYSNQQTNIKTLLTKWKLENRILSTQDVAFSTATNRIAFDGQIDFAKDSIPGITISVVDKNGCSLMDQKLYGKIGKIQTGKLNITKTLLGSIINFANAIVGKDCKPVYMGKVKDPSLVN
jgi:AsmA protein